VSAVEWAGLGAAALGVLAVLGLAIGSFLNVVAYRVPLGLSVVAPPSACPGCGTEIQARDNIPLLSWVVLRGKCRHCAEPISARYPLVEAITGVVFVAVALRFLPDILAAGTAAAAVSSSLVLGAFLYLGAISVALTAIDIDVHRLPDRIVLPSYAVAGALLGAAAVVGGDWVALARALAGAGILVAFYLLLALIKPGGMGLGDVKLAGVLGLFLGQLGWAELAVGTFAAFFLGGIAGLVLILAKRAKRASAIPFGPWMFAGAWAGIFAGQALVDTYLTWVGLS
jgi:leader peptidase (prepilin peptidase) / N-methyltransferase